MDCLFCKIAAGEIPAQKVYEDDKVLAFHDVDPKAPVHLLIIPKAHIGSVAEIDGDSAELAGHLIAVTAKIAGQLGLDDGFRVVTNCGRDGGQTVGHLHFHLLAGRQLSWPPG